MTSFRVYVPDSVVNTGLDSARFASRDEAEEALATLASHPDYRKESDECEVGESKDDPNTTFMTWNEAGW